MKENKNMKCDPCEQDFKKKVDELVKEGHAPSHKEREEREHEVKSAFSEHDAGHAGKMHPDKKHPAMAGMDKTTK